MPLLILALKYSKVCVCCSVILRLDLSVMGSQASSHVKTGLHGFSQTSAHKLSVHSLTLERASSGDPPFSNSELPVLSNSTEQQWLHVTSRYRPLAILKKYHNDIILLQQGLNRDGAEVIMSRLSLHVGENQITALQLGVCGWTSVDASCAGSYSAASVKRELTR